MVELVRLVATATQAAADAATAAAQANSHGGSAERKKELYRLIPKPSVFAPENIALVWNCSFLCPSDLYLCLALGILAFGLALGLSLHSVYLHRHNTSGVSRSLKWENCGTGFSPLRSCSVAGPDHLSNRAIATALIE